MKPCELEVLMHYYVSPAVFPRITSPAVKETVFHFLADDILETSDKEDIYRVTAKGKAFIRMILDTPYPKAVWIDERTNAVIEVRP